jgi:manganese/zinc/iron transport system substrate-binding protein
MMTFRTTTTLIFAIVLSTLLVGCEQTSSSPQKQNGPYTIMATTGMIADIARQVAGEQAHVKALMGEGVDPHLYRPTRNDVSAMLAADVVLYNGLNLEGRMTETFVQVARTGKAVHAVTEHIDESFLLDSEEYEGFSDPHIWMDPRGWMLATQAVVTILSEFDPASASVYQANGEAYLSQLRELDAYAHTSLASVPAQRRVLVTAHDAFQYFARAYELEVAAIQGISTDSEAGLQRIEMLVSMLVSREIPAVFTESSVSDRHVTALIDGARAKGLQVALGGELFSDAMGDPGTYEGTYIGMIDHNVTTITRALGGDAPQRGFQGLLKSQ